MPSSGNSVDRMKHLLSSGEHSDVHFLVGYGDAQEVLPAHQIVLRNASEVFDAMFRFDSKNEQAGNAYANCPAVVEVPDVEPAAFKVMLSFVYADDLSELNGDNAMEVLYAAKKYNIPGLIGPPLQIPISELRNIFMAYAQALLFELEDFVSQCLRHFIGPTKNAAKKVLNAHRKIFVPSSARHCSKYICQISTKLISQNTSELMDPKNGFYKKNDDKVTLAIDVTVNDEKTEEQLIADPNKSNGTLSMEIGNLLEFEREVIGSERRSEMWQIKGFSWKILAKIEKQYENADEKWLSFYILCNAQKADKNWSCKWSATFQIMSQKSGMEDYKKQIANEETFNNKAISRGFPNFISFAELLDPSKGLYNQNEDKVKLAIDVTVK
ncbi:hypothetical protein niasHT_004303 [Heterodera trifolii]|uniref:BTB domain-containing protein n=1 Tax=Heterodera trifolii TaxID=157864 RepID=A0ABD2LQW1_9BILA